MDISAISSNATVAKTDTASAKKSDSEASLRALQQQQALAGVNDTKVSSDDEQGNSEAESADQLQTATEQLSNTMSLMRKGLQFRVDEKSGESVVSVLDIDSGEVIRQIPSEEALKLAEKLTEVAGLLMKTEA